MRIAINTRFLLKDSLEGIGWFTYETVKRMVQAHPETEFLLIFDRPFDESFVFGSNVTPIAVGPPARHPILMWIWYNLKIPQILRKYKADVFLSTDGFASLYTKVPQVMVLHDLAYVHYPKNVKPFIGKFLRYYTPRFIKKCKKIVAVSQYTKFDIQNVYGTAPEKIDVVYNSANDIFKPLGYDEREAIREQYTNGIDYFLYVGSLHPRKNIIALLDAFYLFKRNTTSNMKLVLIGRLAWLTEKIEQKLRNHTYRDDIIRFDYMNAPTISKITASAYASIYPSLFEGFGIPVLEAIRCNVPVITSNTSSLPEVGGKACILIDPKDSVSLADAMMQIYNDENKRNELIAACPEQGKKFDWNRSAEQLYQIVLKAKAQS